MTQLSLGDLAGNFLLRRQNVALQQSMSRLTTEVTTGRAKDTVSHLAGRLSSLAAFERDLDMVDALRISVSEARVQSTGMQAALEQVQDSTAVLADTIATASLVPQSVARASVAAIARQTLDTVLGALNTEIAGRSLFAGTDVGAKPLADVDTLLDGLRTSMSGAATSAEVLAAADAFFDTQGGGFDTLVYQGTTSNLSPVSLGGGQTVRLDIRADDPVLKSTIRTAAVASLLEELSAGLPPTEPGILLDAITGRATADQDRLTRLRSDLGFAEQRIEIRTAELATWKSSVELARNDLLSVDLYQSATELEAVQTQIETLYSLTARSSRLSLVNFLS